MLLAGGLPLMSTAYAQSPKPAFRRSRPGDPSWPSAVQWAEQLTQVRSPLEACRSTPEGAECAAVFRGLKNPWYIGDNVALTQTSGWVDAWTSAPSAYAVAARNTADVVAAVDFARTHRLRLVVVMRGQRPRALRPIISTRNRACQYRECAAPCEPAPAACVTEPPPTFICTVSVQPNRRPRGVRAPCTRKERATLRTRRRLSAHHGCVPMTPTTRNALPAKLTSRL